MPKRRTPISPAAILPVLALALLAVACTPDTPAELLEPALTVNPEQPSYTPFTVAPALQNVDEVRDALAREYPTALREAGIGGRALIWMLVDRDGSVVNTILNESSGLQELDEAAMSVAGAFRFRPAENEGSTVAVWVSLPITFSAG